MSKRKYNNSLYLCVCAKSYSQKRQVRKHISLCEYAQNPAKNDLLEFAISNCELIYVNDTENIGRVPSVDRFYCGCEKHFLSKGGYYRHIKKCHLRPEPQAVPGKTKCNEPGCLMTFKYIKDLRQHLNEKHQIQFDVEEKKFNTYSDFLKWKVNYESGTRSCFYHRKNLTRSGRRVEYWYCNRSGSYQSSIQSRRRKLKSQGLLKINNNCTSSIILSINEIDDTVQAVIHHTHYGHEAELVHLRIPKTDKQEIASKLLQGVNIEDILSSYKEDELSKQTERKHLIKRRDILNISKKHNVNIIFPKVQPSKNKSKYELVHKAVETPIIDSLSNTTETNKRHLTASQLSLSFVSPILENVWRISMGNRLVSTFSSNNCNQGVYNVTKNDVISCSSDNCKSYCIPCNICYHAYSCTCSDFISKTVICEHIHLTVIYQANSETYQNEDHIEECLFGNQDHTKYTQKCRGPPLTIPIENVKLYNICKPINMKAENLKSIKTRLNKLMMGTLQKIDECNNSDLLENLEKQITNISCNLSKDALENATKKRNEVQTMLPEKNIEVYYVI